MRSQSYPPISSKVRANCRSPIVNQLQKRPLPPVRHVFAAPGKFLPLAPASAANPGATPVGTLIGTVFARKVAQDCLQREFATVADHNLFGVHGAALEVRSRRLGLLASNIANASTPGFKARDIDFREAMQAASRPGGLSAGSIDAATKYRIPLQASLDGNTVELATEQTAFAENAVAYQTTLSFLNGRIGQLTRALRGE